MTARDIAVLDEFPKGGWDLPYEGNGIFMRDRPVVSAFPARIAKRPTSRGLQERPTLGYMRYAANS